MKKTLAIVVAVALAGVFYGCGLTDITSGKAFQPAWPEEDTLVIKTAGLEQQDGALGTQSQALVGDRADLHDLSFAVAWQVNAQAYHILATIWFITRFPPTEAAEENGVEGEGEDKIEYDAWAIWGPFRDDEGKNLEFLLKVWRGVDPEDGRRVFIYIVAGRPYNKAGGDEDWVPFVVGGTKPYDGNSDRHGIVQLDMNAIRTLDPTEDDVGVVSYVYMQDAVGHGVAAVGEGTWEDRDHLRTVDSTYFYGRSSEGFAVLSFETQGDVDDTGPELETITVNTAWLYNGDGRSDASVTEGDLEAGVSGTMTECWGLDLKQTYFLYETIGLAPDITVEDGDVSACFTPDPIVLDDVDFDEIRAAFD